MPADQDNSLLSVLMKAGAANNDMHTVVEALLNVQTQLSEIQDNQRKIMKAIRDLRVEQRNRLSDLKKSTQSAVHTSHDALIDQLNEIQDSVEDYEDIDISDLDSVNGVNGKNGINSLF